MLLQEERLPAPRPLPHGHGASPGQPTLGAGLARQRGAGSARRHGGRWRATDGRLSCNQVQLGTLLTTSWPSCAGAVPPGTPFEHTAAGTSWHHGRRAHAVAQELAPWHTSTPSGTRARRPPALPPSGAAGAEDGSHRSVAPLCAEHAVDAKNNHDRRSREEPGADRGAGSVGATAARGRGVGQRCRFGTGASGPSSERGRQGVAPPSRGSCRGTGTGQPPAAGTLGIPWPRAGTPLCRRASGGAQPGGHKPQGCCFGRVRGLRVGGQQGAQLWGFFLSVFLLSLHSCTSWTATPGGRSSWMTSSASCRSEVRPPTPPQLSSPPPAHPPRGRGLISAPLVTAPRSLLRPGRWLIFNLVAQRG